MQVPPEPLRGRERPHRRPALWIIVALLIAITLLHYLTPQVRLPLPPEGLSRHTAERILYILPVAGAALAFGQTAGLAVLALTVLLMLPRALLLSPHPADSLLETTITSAVGLLVTWMIATQEREKATRQKALSRLRAISAVTASVTESLELEQVLNDALDRALEVLGMEAGLIFFLDRQADELILAAYRGISPESATGVDRLKLGEGFCGRVALSGELMVVPDSLHDPRLTRLAVRQEGLRTQVVVPLKSKGTVQGVLAVATRERRRFLPEDLELITAIGNQIGVAIENARLYENMRFYARQITRAQEEERKRIAREAHDETAQILVALSRRLEALTTTSEPLPETVRERLEQLRALASSALQSVRRFSRDLRPPVLDDLGFLPAVEGVLAVLEEEGIQTRLEVSGTPRRLSPEEELALFRIAQEALNNIRRHASASLVVVEVTFDPARVRMSIQDDGQGFDAPETVVDLAGSGKLGLIGMHERARILGGTLAIQSARGRGTTVVVDVPTQPPPRPPSLTQARTGP